MARIDRIYPSKHMTDVETWRWMVDHSAAVFEAFYRITNKAGDIVPLVPNRIQRRVIGLYEWAVLNNTPWLQDILKARQVGMSVIISAICHNKIRHSPGLHGFAMSHDISSTKNIMEIYHTYEEHFPGYAEVDMPIKSRRTSNQKDPGSIEWKCPVFRDGKRAWASEGGSWIQGIAASKAGGGASARANVKHVSEAGFNTAPWAEVIATTNQCNRLGPGDIDVIESTAEESAGFWYDEYWDAKLGNSARKAAFFPYFLHDEYVLELSDDEEWSLERGDGEVIPPFGDTVEEQAMDAAELKEIREAVNEYFRLDTLTGPQKAETRHKVLMRREAALKWRRDFALAKKYTGGLSSRLRNFRRHYPWTDEVCWLSTQASLFDQRKVGKRIHDAHVSSKKSAGSGADFPRWGNTDKTAWIIHPPTSLGEYEIFWDPSFGKEDASAIMVMNWAITDDAKQVRTPRCEALINSKTDIGRQTLDCMTFARSYLNGGAAPPRIVFERSGAGMQIADTLLREFRYKNLYFHYERGSRPAYGFPTSHSSKPRALALLERFIFHMIVDWEPFWQQARMFAPRPDGTVRGKGKYPDEFMSCAWMIAQIGFYHGYFTLPETDGDDMSIPVMESLVKPDEDEGHADRVKREYFEATRPKKDWRTAFMNIKR